MEIDKIYLGDAYKLIKEIPDNSVDLIIIDPPYEFDSGEGGGTFGTANRSYHKEYLSLYHKTEKTKETERLRISANKVKQRKSLRLLSHGFKLALLNDLDKIMKKTNIYIWCSKKQLSKLLVYYEKKECAIDVLTWHKTNPTPTINNTYANDTEYLVFAREKGVKVYGNYETKRKYYVTPANVADKKAFKHPTIKPINIIKNLIINSTQPNDIVLDCFAGSGTTCVAAKELGRHYIGIEIDPEYHKIAVDRVNGITASGQTSVFTDFNTITVKP